MAKFSHAEKITTLTARIALFSLGIACFLIALNEVSAKGLAQFVDSTSAALALIAPMALALYLHRKHHLPFGQLLATLALPIGLLFTGVGLLGMAADIDDHRAVGSASAVLLLTALYGGVLSAMGYLYRDGELTPIDEPISKAELIILQAAFLSVTTWTLSNAGAHNLERDFGVVLLFLSIFIAAVYLGKDQDKPLATTIADASLAGVLLSLVVSLIAWFGSAESLDRKAITFGSAGMVLGTYTYIAAFLFSLYSGGASAIDYAKKNWHLVEANTFFVFLLFVPQNVGEVLRSLEDDRNQQILQQKIDALSQRLDALESKSLTDK